MSPIEQYYRTCKICREQLAQIERHIKAKALYTSFDFGKLQSNLADYETWAQANTGVIADALKSTPVNS